MKKEPVYPNSPLEETIFEIRFPGEPAVECGRDKFFSKIRSKYPKVFIPTVKEFEQALALAPYRFQQEDGQAGVMISLNRFAFFTRKYEGFKNFKKEALRLSNIFMEMFKISKLNRTGLRYINIIPFAREKETIPINDYFMFDINFPKVYPNKFNNISLAFTSATETGSITTIIENRKSEELSQEALSLDFDYSFEDNLEGSKLEGYIEESHEYTKNMFESLITESYRNYLKGETIE